MQMTTEQFSLIKTQFATLKERSPFYARKFDGIDLSDVRSQADFEKLPFSEKTCAPFTRWACRRCPMKRWCASTHPPAPPARPW